MAGSSEQWSSDANEAVEISLLRPGQLMPEAIHKFNPRFTYPIFGEEERIFGYKGLEIDIRFAAHDLRPSVFISYDQKFPAVGDTIALDLNATLKKWVPSEAFKKATDFEAELQSGHGAKDFQPPGKLVHTYTRGGKVFEIWAGSLLDPAVRKLIDRMQIFISFFIEAGTPIDTTDADWTLERWVMYFVYEKAPNQTAIQASPYSFVGYATTYRFYTLQRLQPGEVWPDISSFPAIKPVSFNQLSSRLRISQFLILPPYQHSGHGSALYNSIYANAIADPTVRELSVEDPSEEFDVLRDVNDWRTLMPKFQAANIAINVTPFAPTEKRGSRRLPTAKLLNVEALKTIRRETKIARRQFARQLEMYLLAQIPFSHRAGGGASLTKLLIQKSRTPDPHDKAYYWWRLVLKQRIYKKNRDQLQQLDLEERQPRVEESARAQEDEYEKLLLAFAALAEKENLRAKDGPANGKALPLQERKRKIVEDDDEDGEGSEDLEAKKTKT